MRIGIFGGTFNPVHRAHIELVKFFKTELFLDKVIIVPAYCSPFKNRTDNNIDDIHRIELLKLAFSPDKDFIIESYEIDRQTTSYTIDTINHIRSSYPEGTSFFLLIGTDQWESFDKWKSWMEILQKVQLCIVGRKVNNQMNNSKVEDYCKIQHIQVNKLDSPFYDISSENIRKLIKNSEEINQFVTSEVAEYIRQNKLYL